MLLNITGRIIQVVAVLVVGLAVFWALAMPAYYAAFNDQYSIMSIPSVMQTQQLQVGLGGFLAALIIFAFGGICCAVASSATSNKRSAEALEAIADRRRAAQRP